MQQDVVNQKTARKCEHSHTGKLILVYFCPQTAKNRNGVLFHPTGSRQLRWAMPCI